jgi:hypothetical protein
MRDRRRGEGDPGTTHAASSGLAPGKRSLTAPLAAPVQRKATGAAPAADAATTAEAGVRDGGSALPHGDVIQRAFGHHDVSRVSAHTGGAAAAACDDLGAQAYATGSHVAFRGAPDLHTAAHEAAHVVQQRQGVFLKDGLGDSGDVYERHADAVADAVVAGRPAADLLDGGPAGGGTRGPAVQRQVPPNPRDGIHVTGQPASLAAPTWSGAEVRAIQRELRRLGLYRLTVDGDFGPGTDGALVEAFGDHTWRTMPAADVLTRLQGATPPAGTRGEHALRYGEMFADGLLDFTLGLGFDETGAHIPVLTEFQNALTARGFAADDANGIRLYNEAGRGVPARAFGNFYVKANALTFRPPAGAPRPIHAVVRLVASTDGSQGAQAAQAFHDGMVESDVAYYGGHGRYGQGPDFDRNFRFELRAADGSVEQFIDDYHDLETLMRTEGTRAGRSAWQQFLWRERNGRLIVHGSNAGNIRMNDRNMHAGEFGSNLMQWNLSQGGGLGAPTATGRTGTLARAAAAHPERRYHVHMFNGCRTMDYERALRATPGMGSRETDSFASTESLYWSDIGRTLAVFLDDVLQMQSAEEIARDMDNVQTTTGHAGRGTVQAYGEEDNPVHR